MSSPQQNNPPSPPRDTGDIKRQGNVNDIGLGDDVNGNRSPPRSPRSPRRNVNDIGDDENIVPEGRSPLRDTQKNDDKKDPSADIRQSPGQSPREDLRKT